MRNRQRQAGQYVLLRDRAERFDTAIGIFRCDRSSPRSERPSGVSRWPRNSGARNVCRGAKLVVDFAFEVLGVHRLEARAALKNGRGNGALRSWARCRRRAPTLIPEEREYLDQAPLDNPRRRMAAGQNRVEARRSLSQQRSIQRRDLASRHAPEALRGAAITPSNYASYRLEYRWLARNSHQFSFSSWRRANVCAIVWKTCIVI